MSARPAEQAACPRPSREQLRERWRQMIDDPLLAAIPYKVELNEKGAIEVSPASNRHGILQAFVASELRRRLADGTTITECSIETQIGVRVPDVAWASADFIARHGVTTPFAAAPEICIEILSPSNTAPQMSEKAAAYLEAGASEVWLVSDDAVEIITKSGPRPSSAFGVELTLPS
ncbi:MAG TPA: Uma2 family endonuclease [Gammaproteobacteria bacterium]|nr:Uma2 family endonuclease [Gammaproteobacteria bacterium]